MACRTAAVILFIHVFSVALLSQVTDAPPSTGTAPSASPSAPHIQTQALPDAPESQTETIIGTVTDVKGSIVPSATVVLQGSALSAPLTITANDKGFFEFTGLKPGTYHVSVSAKGFANWTSLPVLIKPGKSVILTDCRLKVAEARTTIVVSSAQMAAEQVKIQEQQRVFGIIPNFYVTYEPNAEPLTTKLKFQLALKVSIDPITFIGAGVVAGIYQAADHPAFVQGMKGYGERYGSLYSDGVIDIMIGGAILPSLLHQDPRYFYQGTGTIKSRALHALSYPFVCKGDNRKLQPNYSTVGGDLATAVIANAYYPAQNTGAEQLFQGFLIGTAERMAASLAQEFIVPKLTKTKKQK